MRGSAQLDTSYYPPRTRTRHVAAAALRTLLELSNVSLLAFPGYCFMGTDCTNVHCHSLKLQCSASFSQNVTHK